jgi:hypothetical protein
MRRKCTKRTAGVATAAVVHTGVRRAAVCAIWTRAVSHGVETDKKRTFAWDYRRANQTRSFPINALGFKTFAYAALLFMALSVSSSAVRAQLNESLIPPAGDPNAFALQKALDEANCFPPGTAVGLKTDGIFGTWLGTKSRQAISNFLAAKNVPGLTYRTTEQLLIDVRNSKGLCPTATAGVCRKDLVSAAYLNTLKGMDKVHVLSEALQTVIDNFDTAAPPNTAVFPADKRDPVVLNNQSVSRIREYGVPRVTPETTLASLKAAAHHFNNLVLSHALKSKDCSNCAKINDWIYLRNIASENSGFLIGKHPNAAIYARFDVTKIPEDLLDQIRPNIRVYRSITAKLNMVLQANSDPALAGNLIAQRDAEMYFIVSRFEKRAKATTRIRMPALAATSKCVGFDGSLIYQ